MTIKQEQKQTHYLILMDSGMAAEFMKGDQIGKSNNIEIMSCS